MLAGDTPCRKPDPRLFQILFDRAGVAAERVLYVGDRLTGDAAGARAAGAGPVWLTPARAPFPGDTPPLTIDALGALPGLIGRHFQGVGET